VTSRTVGGARGSGVLAGRCWVEPVGDLDRLGRAGAGAV
jgi:hypothetical protein